MSVIYSEKKRNRSRHRRRNSDSGLDFKDAKDLQEEYEALQRTLLHDDLDLFSNIIRSPDMKYFLVQNDLDYDLFRDSVRYTRFDFLM